jgi:hypothetical protein
MTSDIPVRCKCGAVRGVAREVSPKTVNRAVCYCHDCRAFAHWLGREDVMDARGGTEIIQLARARLEITDGLERIRCMRLTAKGLHRWYADCCKTPLGNTVPAIPFVGIARGAFEVPPERLNETFGPLLVAQINSAVGDARRGEGMTARGIFHVTRLLATWTLRRLGHPTPLFNRQNRPTVTPHLLTAAERQALREHPRA